MIDVQKLDTYVNSQIEYWQPTGAMTVTQDGKRVYTKTFGYSDKENTRKVGEDEKYFFLFHEAAFPSIALLMLIDSGKIKLTDTLDKYLPEYSHAKEIKIRYLLDSSAAIKCWYNGKIMVDFDKDEAHKALPIEERIAIEKVEFARDRSFAEVLSLINDEPLSAVPGINPGEWCSYTYYTFMQEIVERLSGKSLYAFLKENLFDKYGIASQEGNHTTADGYVMFREITPVYVPKTPAENGVTLTLDGISALAECLVNKQIFSEKMWARLLKTDNNGDSILLSEFDGWKSLYSFGAEGFGLMIHFNARRKTVLTFACTRDFRCELIGGTWTHFIRRVRSELQAQITYPLEPKMEKFCLKNIDVANITVRDDQKDFVSDARFSLCWGYADKDATSYALMDDGTPIGLLILKINKKKNMYYVAIVQIDQRYQGRGYGRFLMDFAVETLKNAGAKELTIGVNRNNVAARRLYESVGFVAAEVYDGGVFMKKTF